MIRSQRSINNDCSRRFTAAFHQLASAAEGAAGEDAAAVARCFPIRRWLPVLVLMLILGMLQPVFAQRDLKDIPPVDPELERKSFQVADGFEVNLYAADPLIAKPIQMNFDPQGRLWIASSEVYPHIKPGEVANDKVLVVEDTDGDGRSDKTTVFAQGLLIPTGIAPGDGGAYVANSTELLHLRDTDGDGQADRLRTVLSGFGTEDTHHILHTLRWGPDGMLYFNQSIYIHSHVETPYGVRRLNAGGIWQFRPESMRLEVFARGWVNSWGHHFDRFGQSFATDGAGGEGINYVIPGAAYATAVGVARIFRGLNPGSPKHCGLEVVSGSHLPDDWQGNLITNDFRGHRVCRFTISDDGAGFASREQPELIKTDHVAFRPIDVKMGPDGAIYIADWYNPIIQHGEVDFRDPRRDHTHGRIWRVTYKGKPTVKRPQLVDAPVTELLDQLKSTEGWTRQQAKRVLKERGSDAVLPALQTWLTQLDGNDPAVDQHRLEALWTYQSLDVPNAELLSQLLQADDARVRAAATRVVQHWQDRLPDTLRLLTQRVGDEHPRVRLEAVRVLGNVPRPGSAGIALSALDQPLDRFLDYALWLTARELRSFWLPSVEAGQTVFGGDVKRLTFALKAVESSAAVQILVDLLSEGKLTPMQQGDAVDLVASLGGPEQLKAVYDVAIAESTTADRRAVLFDTLADAARSRKIRPAGDLQAIAGYLQDKAPAVQAGAARCIGLWKLEAQRDALLQLATSAPANNDVQRAAIDGLAALGGPASLKALRELTTDKHPVDVRLAAVSGIATFNGKVAAQTAVAVLSKLDSGADSAPLFNDIIGQKGGPAFLEQALQDAKLPADVAKIGLRVIGSSGRALPELNKALTIAGGITTGPKSLSPAEMQELVSEIVKHGDAACGEAVYRRSDLSCLKCHAIGGAGGRVGPDLISVGGSAPVDYLVDSLLDPNKKVKENYNTIVVATLEGKVFSGVKLRQTDTDLILRDSEDREIAIPLKSIDEQADGASIMPAGLTEKLTHDELVDLVRFLSALGKVGEYSIAPARVVRRWRVMEPTVKAAFRLRRTSYSTAATDDPDFRWLPAYSNVAGNLPIADLPEVRVRNRVEKGERGVAFVRFELNVSTAGKFALGFASTDGLTLWLNDKPVDVEAQTQFDLSPGVYWVTLAVDLTHRSQSLRVELLDVADSPAQVTVVSGK